MYYDWWSAYPDPPKTFWVWDDIAPTQGREVPLNCGNGSNTGYYYTLAISPNGKLAANTSSGEGIIVTDLETLGVRARIPFSNVTSSVLQFSHSGRVLAAAMMDSEHDLRLWSMAPLATIGKLNADRGSTTMALSWDGLLLAYCPSSKSPNNQIAIWDSRVSADTIHLGGQREQVRAAAFSPDGKLLATGDSSGRVYVWSVDRQALVKQFRCPDNALKVRHIAFSPMEHIIAVIFSDGDSVHRQELLNIRSGAVIASLVSDRNDDTLGTVSFLPDGRVVIPAVQPGCILIFALERKIPVRSEWST